MKILHIISGDIFAGAEMQVLQTLQALSNKNIQCHCILFNNGLLEKKLKVNGISTYIINENFSNIFLMIRKTAQLYKQIKPDLIHVHRAKEHLIGTLSQFLSLEFKPLIRTVHGLNYRPVNDKWHRKIKWFLALLTDQLLIRLLCYAVVAVSDDMLSYLCTFKSVSRIIKLHNAINPADYSIHNSSESILSTRKKYSITNQFWIGSAARLATPKNQMIFIDAAHLISRIIPNTFRFSIFGDGPLRAQLQKRIDDLQLSNTFHLHGFVQDIIPVIASFDLFILCSLHEGLPMALLEAMALGKPIICTAVGGMKEVISSYYNGILIPSDDPDSLADAIKLLYHNHRLRQFISENAKKHICQFHSIEKATDTLLEHYLRFTGRNCLYDF
jgi:glycosyltransferase involved in cell wall biosynthesis